MKSKLLPSCICLLLNLLLLSKPTKAQFELQLVREVVASTGGTAIANGVLYEYTIGDFAILTLSSGNRMLSQGFHQPEIIPRPPLGTPIVTNFMIFPNPVKTTMKIQFDLAREATTTVIIMNAAGQIIFQDIRQYGTGKVLIPVPADQFASGIYTVILKVDGKVYTDKIVIQ